MRCNHCSRKTFSTDAVAWGEGWRWHFGTTQDGREFKDVVCPYCAGTRDPADEPGWDVGCWTCYWSFLDDDFEPGDEPIRTVGEAVRFGREHRCEPDVWIKGPEEDRGTSLDLFDRDGNLRKP